MNLISILILSFLILLFIGSCYVISLFRFKSINLMPRIFLDKLSDILIFTDVKGIIKKLNRITAGLLNYNESEVIGRSIREFVNDPDKVMGAIFRLPAEEKYSEFFEIKFRCSDGGIIPVTVSSTLVRDSKGKNSGFTLIGRDPRNSEEMRLENSRRQQAEEKERLYSQKIMLLYKASLSLTELSPEEDLYSFLAQKIREFAGDCLVFVNSYHDVYQGVQIKALSGSPENIFTFNKILGTTPIGIFIKLDKLKTTLYNGGRIVELPLSLYDMWSGALPEDICLELESALSFTGRFGLGLIKRGGFMGNVEILMRSRTIPDNVMIETLSRLWIMALSNREMENHEIFYSTSFRKIRQNIIEIMNAKNKKDLCGVLSDAIYDLASDSLVITIDRQNDGGEMVIESIKGNDKYIKTLHQILKKDLMGIGVKIGPGFFHAAQKDSIMQISGGLFELSGGVISFKDSELVEKMMDLGNLYAVPLKKGEDINCIIAVMSRSPLNVDSRSLMEIFAAQASLMI